MIFNWKKLLLVKLVYLRKTVYKTNIITHKAHHGQHGINEDDNDHDDNDHDDKAADNNDDNDERRWWRR